MTARNITRTDGTVEIDAETNATDDGRTHVRIAVVNDGVIASEPWYEDTLDELSDADLGKLADEALAAHSVS